MCYVNVAMWLCVAFTFERAVGVGQERGGTQRVGRHPEREGEGSSEGERAREKERERDKKREGKGENESILTGVRACRGLTPSGWRET